MLAKLLNEEALQEIAGERSFDRGANYFADGNVIALEEKNGRIAAKVRGTHLYHVELWAAAEGLAFECDCPVGRDLVFCKHCVAVGLAWLDRRPQKAGASGRQTKRDLSDQQIRAHLMALDKNAVIELLMHEADCDAEFRDRLILKAAQRNGKPPDLAAFRGAIDKAIRHRGPVDYARMPEYTRKIEVVLDSLDDLLKRGHAAEVRELAERALEKTESAMEYVDDSDGLMGGILGRLEEMHLSACLVTKPDPSMLAEFLFEWEMKSHWDLFHGAAGVYEDVLGKKGLADYRKLAEAQWEKIHPLAPGEDDPERWGRRSRITHIMEILASQSGDLEALIAVKSRDLSDANCFLEIAQLYKAAGKHEAALEWAERGARTFPGNTYDGLRAFLIEEYHARSRHGEAIAIAWRSFQEQPELRMYRRLQESASRVKQWPECREKALAVLRENIARERARSPKNEWASFVPADHSPLVEIYLWEGDEETAWREAKSGGCHQTLWFRLAEVRGKDHPEDAIAVYTERLKSALRYAEPSAYRTAVEILRKIQKLTGRIGKERDFAALVQTVRVEHRLRRNLMKLLDAERW